MANMNLSTLSKATTAAQALSNLILVTPEDLNRATVGYQPQGTTEDAVVGPALLFHYESENSITLESDITDHYSEDNTAINDQIALRPEMISVSGYIGELNDVVPTYLEYAKLAAEKLTIIDAYTPVLSVEALRQYNRALFLYNIGINANNARISSWSSITKTSQEATITGSRSTGTSINTLARGEVKNQNKQQIAFQQFYGYWRNRTLFTVQTPWAIFKNMAIKSLRAVQGDDTNVITSFEITFKIIRYATTELGLVINPNANATKEEATPKKVQGRAVPQVKNPATKVGPLAGTRTATGPSGFLSQL